MMIKKGYKVVMIPTCMIGGYMSVTREDMYTMNDWTIFRPGWGPLAIFKDLEDARKFVKRYRYMRDNYAIVTCFYIPSHHRLLYDRSDGELRREVFPPGTDFATMVKLMNIREVYPRVINP